MNHAVTVSGTWNSGLGATSDRIDRLRRWLRAAELDRAAVYAIAGRGWQFLAGPVTLLLIAGSFSPELQGWFYTLSSLLALQTLCDLGLSNTLLHAASHAWARLERRPDQTLTGDRDAMAEIGAIRRGGRRSFARMSLLFLAGAGVGGMFFLGGTATTVNWRLPWLVAVLCSVGSLVLTPEIAILEGCGQVAAVHRQRLWQAIAGNAVVWTGLLVGVQLWIVPLAVAVRLAFELWFVKVIYRPFWREIAPASASSERHWGAVVWPLQWRAAIQSLMVFLAYQLFVPILFRTHGPEAAGRFGMTWSILVTLQAAAIVWVQTRTSAFGVLVQQRQFQQLDASFQRVVLASWIALATGVLVVVTVVGGLAFASDRWPASPVDVRGVAWLVQRLHQRLLPLLPTLLLGLGVLAFHLPQCQTIYLRSFLRDPLLLPSVILNGLMAVGAIYGGTNAGALGIAVAYVVITLGGFLPVWSLIWRRYRARWQAEAISAENRG